MTRKTIFLFLLLVSSWCNAQLKYPVAPRKEVIDTIFKTIVSDPFRPLEYDVKETSDWLLQQNDLVTEYRKANSKDFDKLRAKIDDYSESYSPTYIKKGKYYYRYFVNSNRTNASLYLARSPHDEYQMIINPGWFAKGNESVGISDFYVSSNNEYVAVTLSKSGSDWNEVRVQELSTGKFLDDVIIGLHNDDISWRADGFYYWKYPSIGLEKNDSKRLKQRRLYYHTLKTTQEKDLLVHSEIVPEDANSYQITPDEKFMLLNTVHSDTSARVWLLKDLENNKEILLPDSILSPKSYYRVIIHDNNKLYLKTNYKAPNGHIIALDLTTLQASVIIKEYADILEEVQIAAQNIMCLYYRNGRFGIVLYDLNGKETLANQFTVGQHVGLMSENNKPQFFITAFNFPKVIYEIDLEKKKLEALEQTFISHNKENFITKYIKYPSKDGTMIPMYITYRKDIEIGSGDNPVLLYGYGGFGSSTTPFFEASNIVFMEAGGVLAVPQIRGGGEFGEEWHKAAKRLKKQTTFDDFIAAAEYLIKIRLTNPDKIAINGASHGGLLVGACMTQRPDLYKAAIPEVGVFDMVRFEKFTVGGLHRKEFGTVSNEEDFKNLYSYSPLHNIKEHVNYPATLVMTSDSDDRVPPLHSYKFTARLQEVMPSTHPCLIYVNEKAGHYGASKYNDHLDYEAMKYSFIFKQLGMSVK